MRAAISSVVLAIAAAACSGSPGEGADNNADANLPAAVETLPPDEAAATPSNELVNGAAEPHVNELGNQH